MAMITIDSTSQGERENYKLLTGSIIPRPIAFVTTLSSEGVLNAAPFSYFNIVTANPPMISISVQRKQGVMKDTARNAISEGSFVVHISDESYMEQINETVLNLPPDESEVELAGLTPITSKAIPVPGVAESRIRMECVLEKSIPLGGEDGSPATDLLIGRVVFYHFDESVYQNGHVEADKLKPVSRLAGQSYSKLGEVFSLTRP